MWLVGRMSMYLFYYFTSGATCAQDFEWVINIIHFMYLSNGFNALLPSDGVDDY